MKRLYNQIIKNIEKKRKKWEFIDPISSIQNLFGEEHYIPVKIVKSFFYIQYESDGDVYFKALWVEKYFEEMKLG